MNKEAFLLGYPIEFKNLCLVYPPKIKDVVSNKQFLVYLKLLTMSQEEIDDDLASKNIKLERTWTPIEFLLSSALQSKQIEGLIKKAFQLFIHEDVIFLYDQKSILIGDVKDAKSVNDLRILEEEQYFDFQNLIRESCGIKAVEPYDPNMNPRLREMKAKARLRDRIKAKSGQGLNFYSSLIAICCMDMGLNPLNIGELSYAAVSPLMQMYQQKEKYDLDTRSLLAGADSKKVKPKYWVKNLEE